MAKHEFTLYVSNQSFEVDPVDIEVEVDGEVVASREFDVGDEARAQHEWRQFRVELEAGEHRIAASSRRGEARLASRFEIDGPRWATLAYWSQPTSSGKEEDARRFTLEFSDRPIGFY